MAETADVTAPDGRTIAFAEWGVPGGRPLFVLHGAPGSRYLRHIGGVYERQRARVITYDRPGYGQSTRRPGLRVADAAEDVALLADRLGIDEFAVLGISAGGPRALAVAALMPDRVTRCATELGVGDYTAPDLDFFAGMSDEDVREWKDSERGEAWLVEHAYPELVTWLDSPDPLPGVSGELREMLLRALRESVANGPAGYVDDSLSLVSPWGFTLDQVKAPTLVLAATEDESVPRRHAEWLVARIRDAEPVWSPGGHIADHSKAEERVIRWLVGR
jgi:pimeloyl-ACP methyl ester carboxylesterase